MLKFNIGSCPFLETAFDIITIRKEEQGRAPKGRLCLSTMFTLVSKQDCWEDTGLEEVLDNLKRESIPYEVFLGRDGVCLPYPFSCLTASSDSSFSSSLPPPTMSHPPALALGKGWGSPALRNATDYFSSSICISHVLSARFRMKNNNIQIFQQ